MGGDAPWLRKGRNRTYDLQLMRLASYLCSTPQYYQSVLFINQYVAILSTSSIAENALYFCIITIT